MRRPWSSSWHCCSPGLSAGKQGLVRAPVCLLLLWQFLEILFRGSWHVSEVEKPLFPSSRDCLTGGCILFPASWLRVSGL